MNHIIQSFGSKNVARFLVVLFLAFGVFATAPTVAHAQWYDEEDCCYGGGGDYYGDSDFYPMDGDYNGDGSYTEYDPYLDASQTYYMDGTSEFVDGSTWTDGYVNEYGDVLTNYDDGYSEWTGYNEYGEFDYTPYDGYGYDDYGYDSYYDDGYYYDDTGTSYRTASGGSSYTSGSGVRYSYSTPTVRAAAAPKVNYAYAPAQPSRVVTAAPVVSTPHYTTPTYTQSAPAQPVNVSQLVNVSTNPQPTVQYVYQGSTGQAAYQQPQPVQPTYYQAPAPVAYQAPVNNAPRVALSQIPYTGLDLGPVGNAMYWTLIVGFAAAAGYLVVYYAGSVFAFDTGSRTLFGAPNTKKYTTARTHSIRNQDDTEDELPTMQAANSTEDTMFVARSTDGTPRIVIARN